MPPFIFEITVCGVVAGSGRIAVMTDDTIQTERLIVDDQRLFRCDFRTRQFVAFVREALQM